LAFFLAFFFAFFFAAFFFFLAAIDYSWLWDPRFSTRKAPLPNRRCIAGFSVRSGKRCETKLEHRLRRLWLRRTSKALSSIDSATAQHNDD
jgi:hypothetical protein